MVADVLRRNICGKNPTNRKASNRSRHPVKITNYKKLFMKTITSFLLLLSTLSACMKKISCSDPEISLGFVALPIEDMDTIVLRKFVANTNYQTLIDTLAIYRDINSSIRVFSSGDTAVITLYDRQNSLRPGFDWQIFNPATNNTYTVSGIAKEDKERKCGTFTTACFCENNITSIAVNNQNALPNNLKFNVLFLQ